MENNITLEKIAYSIAHTMGNPYERFFVEKIKFLVSNYRATLLRQDLAKNSISKSILLSLTCLPVQCVDVAECCGGNKSFTNALRTVDKIPKPLRTKDNDSYYYVGGIDKMSPYNETTFIDYLNTKYLRFTSTITRYALLDDYIYILNPPSDLLKKITIIDPFEDITQVLSIKNCDGVNCYTDDDIFPIPADMVGTLEDMVLNHLRNQPINDDKEIKVNKN